jgi:hypothetical protein
MAGCSSSSLAPADGGGDGGGDGSNGRTADGGTGDGCNSLALLGPTITSTCANGVAPQPTGGPIIDGTYVLTAMTFYGGCQTVSFAETVVLSAETVQAVASLSAAGLTRANERFTISGTNLLESHTCPNSDTATTPYSATPNTLLLFSSGGTGTATSPTSAALFARQP